MKDGAIQPATGKPLRGRVRILVVFNHQPVLVQLARLALTLGVYDMHTTTPGAEAVAALATQRPHLVLLDMDLGGPAIIERLGGRGPGGARLPVIGLTRRGDLTNKLAAFEAGVDDVLTIPFAPEELLARVVAVVRRSYHDVVTLTPAIKLGELEIDILNRSVRIGDLELHLTPLEQSLLYLLAANSGRVISRDEILDTLWGADYVAESNVVDRQIRNLREQLHDDWRQPRFIATVPGRGYQILPGFFSALATPETPTDGAPAENVRKRLPPCHGFGYN